MEKRIKKLHFIIVLLLFLKLNCIVDQNGFFSCVNADASLLTRFVFTWTGEVNKRTHTHVHTYSCIWILDAWFHDETGKLICQEYIYDICVSMCVCVCVCTCVSVYLSGQHVSMTLNKVFLLQKKEEKLHMANFKSNTGTKLIKRKW